MWSRERLTAETVELGWRLVLGALCTAVATRSLAESAEVAARAIEACGSDAEQYLRADLRPGRVLLRLRGVGAVRAGPVEVGLAGRISASLAPAHRTEPDAGPRHVQTFEIAIDALDIDSVRPFWRAVLDYVDDPDGALSDPLEQGPSVWFQQQDAPRPQRNRIHLDISVPHEEAPRRIAAALAAGGRLCSDAEAPAFWVLADAEGNEACVTTWQGRDAPAGAAEASAAEPEREVVAAD